MRIAFLYPGDFLQVIGSTEPYYIYRHLSKKHEIYVFSDIKQDRIERYNPNVKFYQIRKNCLLPYLFTYNVMTLIWLLKTSLRINFDLVYAYKGVLLPPIFLKLFFRIKVVFDFRTPPIEQTLDLEVKKRSPLFRFFLYQIRIFYRFCLKYFDLIVVISKEIKELLSSQYGVPSRIIYIQSLGVDLDLFKPTNDLLKKFQGTFKIIYVGSITISRCPLYLFESIKILSKKIPNIKLVFVGSGPNDDILKLKEIICKLDLETFMEWYGRIPHNLIPRVLEEADLALSLLPPFFSYQVSSPAKVFEYLAMGKVVLATNISAHRKIIKNGWNGLLIEPEDREALVEAIGKIYNDRRFREMIELNARQSVIQYNWNSMLNKLDEKLRTLDRC